jgi:hypothetical protein
MYATTTHHHPAVHLSAPDVRTVLDRVRTLCADPARAELVRRAILGGDDDALTEVCAHAETDVQLDAPAAEVLAAELHARTLWMLAWPSSLR